MRRKRGGKERLRIFPASPGTRCPVFIPPASSHRQSLGTLAVELSRPAEPLKPGAPTLCPAPSPITSSSEQTRTVGLTCHGVFPGSVFPFSSVVSGVAAGGLIVCFPFFEADHFPRWCWGTCYIKKSKGSLSLCHPTARAASHTNTWSHKGTGRSAGQYVYTDLSIDFYFCSFDSSLSPSPSSTSHSAS